jgi:dihydrofolate reductase
MNICAIAAVAENGVIGKDGELPWHYPEDLEHFRDITMNNPIIMGRKTFDSFPEPLPNRTHIVLTKNESLEHDDDSIRYVNTPEEALKFAESITNNTSYIIGGRTIYELFFDDLDSMIISEIHADYDGDTYFPTFDSKNWNVEYMRESDDFDIAYYKR